MEIPYEVDDTLVRGLDYYSETVFEFHYTSKKGNNYGAIGAGGHYDKLVKEVGGPDVPGVGFSFGVERIVNVLSDDELVPDLFTNLDAYVMPIGADSHKYALEVADELRLLGYRVDMCFDDVKLANMFKRAERKGAKLALIVGEEEIKNQQVIIKNMATQEQFTVKFDEFTQKCEDILVLKHCCGGKDKKEGECCQGGKCDEEK